MRGEEIEHRQEHRWVGQAVAQLVGGETRQRQQPLGAALVLEHPHQRGERQRFGVTRTRCLARLAGLSALKNCQPPVKALTPAHQRAGAWSVAKRIMVVEDNDLNRKLFCDVLKANGYEVVPVADGQNVLETAKKAAPELVIMDIQLPNVSGIDLIAQLKQDPAFAQTPVLAVTAYAGKGDEERIRDAGASDYLAKPVSIGPFIAAVKALLGD